jgi:hypothetical protein
MAVKDFRLSFLYLLLICLPSGESAGLLQGDIILEYDGVPINSARQLVSEVEKKSQISQIEMVIVRQKIPTRVILNGGFIGVRILTNKIPRDEITAYR